MDGIDNTDGTTDNGETGASGGISIMNPQTSLDLFFRNQIMTDVKGKADADAKGEPWVRDDARSILY